MRVVRSKTEPKCKICRSEHRDEVDALLMVRSNRGSIEGVRITGEYVIERCAEWGITNPNAVNLTSHWKQHCQVSDGDAVDGVVNAQLDTLAELEAGGPQADVDSVLRSIVTLGAAGIRARVARGENPIGVDHVLKASAELTKRQHNEAQHTLLGELVGGVQQALGGGPRQIGAGEVVDTPDETIQEADFEPVEADEAPADETIHATAEAVAA